MEQKSIPIQNGLELTISILKELLDQDNARFRFLPYGTFVYIEDKSLDQLLDKYTIDKDEFDNNVRKIIRLVLEYINNENQDSEYETKLISKFLPIDKWNTDYLFVSMAVADTINEVSFQPLIKPLKDGKSIKTGILKLSLNQNETSNNKDIKIEFNADNLDGFISKLKEYKEKLLALD